MLNVIFAFCMFLSGLGFNLNATLEGAGIDAPLAAGATEEGPLSDLLIAVNDISIENQVTDEEFYSEEENVTYSSDDYVSSIDDIEADLLADHHAPVGCAPRVRRCKPKCHRKPVKRCCKPKVRKCQPKCQKIRRCAPKVRKCKPKCHPKPKRCCKRKPVKRCCKPKVRRCKPKCHKPVKRCCKPKVRKCNPQVRRCAPVRKPVVRQHVAPVGCAPRVVREVRTVPVGCAPAIHSAPSYTHAEPVIESHYPVQQYDAPVSASNQPVSSGYTGQPSAIQGSSTIQLPPTYRAPSPEVQYETPDRASVSSIW